MIHWQYRTIVFEFQKDGLLGDRFIDDEGVENTLNEQGRNGWELVSATMIQDGLLTLLKRPAAGTDMDRAVDPVQENASVEQAPSSTDSQQKATSAVSLQQQEKAYIEDLERRRKQAMEQREQCLVGEIRIR
ncbi:MAG: hypothetical protein DSY57_06365 [Desulfobulbus sp.]|nr:MAG: hypothetical protein DSY57_06365 [Desulfobulbus sp.]